MSTESKLRISRGVMSHEYGHYVFCNMIFDADEDAVDHSSGEPPSAATWSRISRSATRMKPWRITSRDRSASGADYGWLEQAEGRASIDTARSADPLLGRQSQKQ